MVRIGALDMPALLNAQRTPIFGGLSALCPSGGQLLFHLISHLYERASVIVTTNLAFGEWPSVYGSVGDYFGPKAPAGEETNWVHTVPGKGWTLSCVSTVRLTRGLTKLGDRGEIELAE